MNNFYIFLISNVCFLFIIMLCFGLVFFISAFFFTISHAVFTFTRDIVLFFIILISLPNSPSIFLTFPFYSSQTSQFPPKQSITAYPLCSGSSLCRKGQFHDRTTSWWNNTSFLLIRQIRYTFFYIENKGDTLCY